MRRAVDYVGAMLLAAFIAYGCRQQSSMDEDGWAILFGITLYVLLATAVERMHEEQKRRHR